ncbi:retrovirus-related pol polyprotein from transposon TNT 1-94 [Tanacetum coccineum]
MTSTVGKQEINAVKPTAYWAWRPKVKMINHVYKNTGSCVCKQFNYVDPTGRNKLSHVDEESSSSDFRCRRLFDFREFYQTGEDVNRKSMNGRNKLQREIKLQSGVHSLFLDGTSKQINMLVDKKYPLKKEILEKMINLKIEAEESDMASELIKFIKSQIAEHERILEQKYRISRAIYRIEVCTAVCAGAIYPDKVVSEPGYNKQGQKTTSREYTNYLLSAEDKGRGYDRGQEAKQKQVKIMGKEVNMAAGDSDEALVCCVENTVEDHIMDSGASFHATYCKQELERFKLRSGKVCLAYDMTLDIAGIRDVVLKTYFGTSLTLKDVRYIPGLKRRLISVGQLDEEGYHVGFGDQQWKDTKGSLVVARGNKGGSLYMVEQDWWFGKAEEAFFHNLIEDKETAENVIVILKMVPETPLEFGVAERLSQTFRAESMRLHAEAPHILWADSASTTYLIYRIPYVLIGLRIPEEEWRGKDTSLTHLKTRFIEPENLAKNDCIVAEHGLSSEITQSPGGSSDTSEGSENSGNFKDSGRSDEEYSKDGASSKEGGSETLQEDEMQTLINMLNMLSSYKFDSTMKASTLTSAPTIASSTSLRIKDGIVELKSYMIEGEPWVYGVGFVTIKLSGKLMDENIRSEVSYLIVYVDDIILTASSTSLLQQIISSLHSEFDMTDLKELTYFLGISEVLHSTGLFLSQRQYASQLLEHAHMANCNPSWTPVDTECKLSPEGVRVQDPTLYRSQYLTFTRQQRIKDGIVELKSDMIEGEPCVYGVGFVTIKLSGKWMAENIHKMLRDSIDTWAPRQQLEFKSTIVNSPSWDESNLMPMDGNGMSLPPDTDEHFRTVEEDAEVLIYVKHEGNMKPLIRGKSRTRKSRTRKSRDGCFGYPLEDLGALWHGLVGEKADWIVCVTPTQQQDYIETCFNVSKFYITT